MGMKNISKLFFKDYYKNINFAYALKEEKDENQNKTLSPVESINQTIKRANLFEIPKVKLESDSNCCTEPMYFKILYPGLVTGIGLVHDSKKIKGAFNLGMHFDYTYGMPVVYGSSVKGVLRHYFKEFYTGHIDKEKLEEDIFSGITPDDKKKPIYERDIFFDAVIVETYKGRLLEDDSITPHGDDPLKNPIPITMLKVAGGCVIEFRFCLRDSLVDGKKFTAKEKWECFKEILETVGVGAKTNIGYGQLESVTSRI